MLEKMMTQKTYGSSYNKQWCIRNEIVRDQTPSTFDLEGYMTTIKHVVRFDDDVTCNSGKEILCRKSWLFAMATDFMNNG